MMVSDVKDVREGYRMTEFGEIPIEWDVATLGEVLRVGYGKNQKDVEVEKSDIPILGTGGIIGWARTPLFEKPSVLIGRKGTIDKPQYMEKPFWTIDTLFYTDINIEKNFPKFIYYLFQTIDWYKYNEATGVPSLSATNISKIKHSFPPLKEQQKIAEILSTVDEQIENTNHLIDKTKELKKGLMQQLLTKGIGHTEFKQTELGEIPLEWGVALLKDVCEKISDGTHHSPLTYPTGEYMYITAKNIKENGINLDNISFVEKEIHEEIYKRCDVKKNDVLYIKDGATTGVATVNNLGEEFSLLSSVALLRAKKDIFLPRFLMYCLNSPIIKQRMLDMMSGNAIRRLTLKVIQTGVVPLPSIEEQQKIAEILSTVDDQIESYQQEKEKYTELKKGLMQQLLTGKIRVTV
ncbi:restriction endonuclease subunit S [Peribacillus castrilensis]|uniref:restriction endonuclease subunit S n=1 Tax=Bacillaceae TaxID=186817 RepID=UPI00069DFC52|nr:restriction endonuclease subunit S [Bacillus sp. 445_BSPC]